MTISLGFIVKGGFMSGNRKGLCPVSLGGAVGIVCAVCVFFWSIWVMHNGIPAMLAIKPLELTWTDVVIYTLVGLLKGFLFGFFVALLYDWFICCCKAKCCKDGQCCCSKGSDCKCGGGCSCHSGQVK